MVDNQFTPINDYPKTYEFLLLNVARLLLRSSQDKSKIKFLHDLCTEYTLFICLCETFLFAEITDPEIFMPGYTVIRCDRSNRIGGGVCLYLRESIIFDILLCYSNSICELLIVKLIKPELIIILLYRPPSCDCSNFEDIIHKMFNCMYNLSSPLPNIILLGDFNLPKMDWLNPRHCFVTRALCPFIDSFFLEQLVHEPTRKDNILDLIFSNSDVINSIDICSTFISDHCLLSVQTTIPQITTHCAPVLNPPSSVFDMLNFKRCNWEVLCTELSNINWSSLLSNCLNKHSFDIFIDAVANVCSQFIPLSKNPQQYISKFHRERKIMMKKRTKLRRQMLSTPSCSIRNKLHSIEEDIISSHSNERNHEETIAVSKIKEDPNFFFRYAKRFSISKQVIGPFISSDGNMTSDKQLICFQLLEQFNSVFSVALPDKIVTNPIDFFSETNDNELESLMTDITINEQIIIDAITEISISSAPGPDGIQASLWKNCSKELSVPLTILFRLSLDTGFIPDFLKRAAIVPIFKSGNKALPSNYRPISLTPILMKILERIIRKQVTAFLVRNGHLNQTQHGFREGRSCLSALLSVYDDLMNLFTDSPCSVDMIYLDFAKAFDKVDHGVLLHKLRDFGITGKLGVWFHSFLSNRKQFVRIQGGTSDDSTVLSGVPQGTVLGPLLFLILMSDIDSGVTTSKIISFADDTRLYNRISVTEDCDSLQTDLNSVYDWAVTNNMVFNSKKFQYISLYPRLTISSDIVNAYITPEMNLIDHVDHLKDLGIIMSSNCSFEQHIIELSKRCSSLCGWILRTFSSREPETMMTLFKSLVLSRLDYGSQLWSPSKLYQVNMIERVQRSFTKHIKGLYYCSYKDRLCALNLYSLQRRRERYIIIYIWKILENRVPNMVKPIDSYMSNRRGRLCSASHVGIGYTGTLAYTSFRWKGIRLFNSLPMYIRNITNCSPLTFKKKLDLYLLTISDNPSVPNFDNSLVKF